MSINWYFKYLEEKELYGNEAYDTDQDCKSISDAKKRVKQHFKNLTCENCGGRKMSGYSIIVDICKVKMYQQHLKKGFFGGEKYVDKHWKTIWRLGNVYAKAGGFFGGAGSLKCNSCKHEIKGRSAFWGQWAANIAEAKRRGDFD